jgi:uncharacterized membrane protein
MNDSFGFAWNEVFSHFFGLLAIAVSLYSINLKDDNKMMAGGMICSVLFIPHFVLIGANVSAVSMILLTARVWFAKNHPSKFAMWAFLLISAIQAFIMVDNWEQSFSVLSAFLATIIYFKLKGVAMRLCFVVTCALWVADGVIVGSYQSVLLNVIGGGIHLVTAFRIYKEDVSAKVREHTSAD